MPSTSEPKNLIYDMYTIYTYGHLIVWPSSVTLTFNVPEQTFQMNNCANFFLNPCIYHLAFKCDLDFCPTLNVFNEQLYQLILKSKHYM